MKAKRLRAIKRIEWFMPSNCDWNHKNTVTNDGTIGISTLIESANGQSAEEAFFSKVENGKLPEAVTDKARLRSLLWGHRWMATHEKMWREGFMENTLFLSDFEKEEEYIQEIARAIWLKLGRDIRA